MLGKFLDNVREVSPLVHNITNYVTVNDCANILLACGGSPIMADDSDEVEEITSICGGLNINIGTLNRNTIPSMIISAKKSNEVCHPVLLDPVGAGASKLRTDTSKKLLEEAKFAVIRGNISEIKALFAGTQTTKGVDADINDKITDENINEAVSFAKEISKNTGAIIAITGEIDLVCDKDRAFVIRNGHADMGRITGTGCMLSAMTTAFLVANPDEYLMATVFAIATMGVAGELARNRMNDLDGNSSYRNYIIDAIYNMDAMTLDKMAKVEEVI